MRLSFDGFKSFHNLRKLGRMGEEFQEVIQSVPQYGLSSRDTGSVYVVKLNDPATM